MTRATPAYPFAQAGSDKSRQGFRRSTHGDPCLPGRRHSPQAHGHRLCTSEGDSLTPNLGGPVRRLAPGGLRCQGTTVVHHLQSRRSTSEPSRAQGPCRAHRSGEYWCGECFAHQASSAVSGRQRVRSRPCGGRAVDRARRGQIGRRPATHGPSGACAGGAYGAVGESALVSGWDTAKGAVLCRGGAGQSSRLGIAASMAGRRGAAAAGD